MIDNELYIIGDVTTETIDSNGVYSVTSGERLPTFPYYGNSRQRRKVEAEKHNAKADEEENKALYDRVINRAPDWEKCAKILEDRNYCTFASSRFTRNG